MSKPDDRSAPAAVPLAAARSADVEDDGDDQNNQVDSGDRVMLIDQPRIHDSSDRQKEEADDGKEQVLIGALEVVTEEKHQHEDDSREGEHQDDEEARH